MLNEAAKKLVARAARAEATEWRDWVARGANIDAVCEEAWRDAQQLNPDFREWPSAQHYFEAVFCREIEQ